ncbi:MAG: hypothetical protein KDC37_03315 [Flavobacteriales bacterium]|nr:hypothetical protein [Flavobacteriales bacterium]
MALVSQPITNIVEWCCYSPDTAHFDHGGLMKFLAKDLSRYQGYVQYGTHYKGDYGIYPVFDISDSVGENIPDLNGPNSHFTFALFDSTIGINTDMKIFHAINLEEGYLATGIFKDRTAPSDYYKLWVVELDTGFYPVNQLLLETPNKHINGLHIAPNGQGFIITGFVAEDFDYPFSGTDKEIFVMSLDQNLSINWSYVYNSPFYLHDNDMGAMCYPMGDGNLLVTGSANYTKYDRQFAQFDSDPGILALLLDQNGSVIESHILSSWPNRTSEREVGRDIIAFDDSLLLLSNNYYTHHFGIDNLYYNSTSSPMVEFKGSYDYASTAISGAWGWEIIGMQMLPDVSNGRIGVSGMFFNYTDPNAQSYPASFLGFVNSDKTFTEMKVYDVPNNFYLNTGFFYPNAYSTPAIYTPYTGMIKHNGNGWAIFGYHDDPYANNNHLMMVTDINGEIDAPCHFDTYEMEKILGNRRDSLDLVIKGNATLSILTPNFKRAAPLTDRDRCWQPMYPKEPGSSGNKDAAFYRMASLNNKYILNPIDATSEGLNIEVIDYNGRIVLRHKGHNIILEPWHFTSSFAIIRISDNHNVSIIKIAKP